MPGCCCSADWHGCRLPAFPATTAAHPSGRCDYWSLWFPVVATLYASRFCMSSDSRIVALDRARGSCNGSAMREHRLSHGQRSAVQELLVRSTAPPWRTATSARTSLGARGVANLATVWTAAAIVNRVIRHALQLATTSQSPTTSPAAVKFGRDHRRQRVDEPGATEHRHATFELGQSTPQVRVRNSQAAKKGTQ